MSVYSFYIFDRHSTYRSPIYLLLADALATAECIYTKRFTPTSNAPMAAHATKLNTDVPASLRRANKDSDDAKLVFGTIFSLRRMCKQLGGGDDQFLSYRTSDHRP